MASINYGVIMYTDKMRMAFHSIPAPKNFGGNLPYDKIR
jgi:hypothetical protein